MYVTDTVIMFFQTEVVIVSYKITSMYTDLLKSKKFGIVIIVSIIETYLLSINKIVINFIFTLLLILLYLFRNVLFL